MSVRRYLHLLLHLFPLLTLYAGEVSLTPREVYVGDRTVLRYRFVTAENADVDSLLLALPDDGAPHALPITADDSATDYTLHNAVLSRIGDVCVLTLTLTPWRTTFDLPPLFLGTAAVDVPPVTIGSLAERLNASDLRPLPPPVLIPGTTYLIFALIAAIPVLLTGIIVFVLHLNAVTRVMRRLVASVALSDAGRTALRQLKELQRRPLRYDARDYAAALETLARCYLEARFALHFTAQTVPELLPAVATLIGETAAQKLPAVFRRCDYIRYAGDVTNTSFLSAERIALCGDIRALITGVEKGTAA